MDVLKTVDPNAAIFTLGGVKIDGYADDSQIKISQDSETWKTKKGTTGEAARFRNRGVIDFIEVTLLQTSDSNDYLSAKHEADKRFGVGTFAVDFVDKLGTTDLHGVNCYLEKRADIERGNEIKSTVWRVVCPLGLDGTLGGNTQNVDS